MRVRLVTLLVIAAVLVFSAPAAADTPVVVFTDTGFSPTSVVTDPIRFESEPSVEILNRSSQAVQFCIGLTCSPQFQPGATFFFDFAGTYVLTVPQFPHADLPIGVPMNIESASRAGITLRWSTDFGFLANLPLRFDVQWRQDTSENHPRWQDLTVQTSAPVGTFVPPHPGHYVFRMRECDISQTPISCSLWSPETRVKI